MAAVAALALVVLLFSVIVHEVMHGMVARYFGDHTAEDAGRLTLNPIPHIDPFGSILLPIITYFSFGIALGAAKPVPVNPLNFSNIKKGEFWVSVAGILSNLGLAILASLLYHFLNSIYHQPILEGVLFIMVRLNIALAIFNLIPVPPLDGSKVLMSLLPYNLAKSYMQIERYGILVLMILVFLPIGGSSIVGLIVGPISTSIIHLLGF